jgi:hypothetical protein
MQPSLPLNCFAFPQLSAADEVLESVGHFYRQDDRQNISLGAD